MNDAVLEAVVDSMVARVGAELLPRHVLERFAQYVVYGYVPGGFLRAVLENDLVNAATKADETNLERLRGYAVLLYNGLPRAAWGSRDEVHAWATARHQNGPLEGWRA